MGQQDANCVHLSASAKRTLLIIAVVTQIVATYGLITMNEALLLTTAPVGIMLLVFTGITTRRSSANILN